MTESLITLLGQLLHFQNGFKGAELPAHFLDGLQSGSWPHQLLDTWSATTAFFVAEEECGGCTPEPLPFRRLLRILLQIWSDGEAAAGSVTSRLADEAVIRLCMCVCVSLSLLLFSLITISEVISDASLTVLSKQGEFSKLFAMSTKGNRLSSFPSSSK